MTITGKNLNQIVYFSSARPELAKEALLKRFVRATRIDRFGTA